MDLHTFIQLALKEDIGDGDHSTLASIDADAQGVAKLIIKEEGILAGVDIAQEVFHYFDPSVTIKKLLSDGTKVKYWDIAFEAAGPARSILTAERLVLNIMQRMSGIATTTYELVKMVQHTQVTLLDTRKTTPLFRYFEKMAVKIGGGQNHRMGLYDMVMLKDNHIDYAGGVIRAIEKTNAYLKENNKSLKIEIEIRNFDELDKVLKTGGVDIIMLDNFTPADIRIAMNKINKKYKVEASGGINRDNLIEFAETGVDFISIGALTHHVKSLDMSLKANINKN
jgi:nicotinate-nucleotide pyrophosphorylase (carboxylating)